MSIGIAPGSPSARPQVLISPAMPCSTKSIWYRTVARVTRLDDPSTLRVLPLEFDLLTSEVVLSWGEQNGLQHTHHDLYAPGCTQHDLRFAVLKGAHTQSLLDAVCCVLAE